MADFLVTQLFSGGGPILLVLLASSIVGLTTAIAKAMQFAQMGVGRHGPARMAMATWQAGDAPAALAAAERDRAALSQVVAIGLRMRIDGQSAGNAVVARATELLAAMSRNLRVLEAVVQAAPMLGLLGTVIGMMEAFSRLSETGGAADPALLATGIWTALSTTALGLAVAIPFYFLSTWLESRVEGERMAMEAAVAGFADPK